MNVSSAGAISSLLFVSKGPQTSRPAKFGEVERRMTVEARPLQFRAAMEAQGMAHPAMGKMRNRVAGYLYCEKTMPRRFASTNERVGVEYIGVGLR